MHVHAWLKIHTQRLSFCTYRPVWIHIHTHTHAHMHTCTGHFVRDAEKACFSHLNTHCVMCKSVGVLQPGETKLLWPGKWFGNLSWNMYEHLSTWDSPLECRDRCGNKMLLTAVYMRKIFAQLLVKFYPFSTSSLDTCEEGKCAGE